jgi:hypothetical protein
MKKTHNDPKHWRDRAAAMRALAATMKDPETTAISSCGLKSTTRSEQNPKGNRIRTIDYKFGTNQLQGRCRVQLV